MTQEIRSDRIWPDLTSGKWDISNLPEGAYDTGGRMVADTYNLSSLAVERNVPQAWMIYVHPAGTYLPAMGTLSGHAFTRKDGKVIIQAWVPLP